MKYLKILGLVAIAVAALMAFAGTASAKLTSPAGTTYGGTIHASAEGQIELGSFVDVKCQASTISGSVASGATSGSLSTLTFTGCGVDTVTVLNKGSLAIESNGTVRSTGAEITILTHRTIVIAPHHFMITTHCIYKTNNTVLGTLTESSAKGGATATIDINDAEIPQVSTDGACGDTATWTGSYSVTTPDYLDVD